MRRLLSFALVAVVLSCKDRSPTAPTFDAPNDVSAAIVDGAHAGNPHFYFLPPLAPLPPFSGTFDGSLLSTLRVEVCALTGGSCATTIASFGATEGDGAVVKVSERDEHYQLVWKTTTDGIVAGGLYRLTVFSGTQALGTVNLTAVRDGSVSSVDPTQYIPFVIGRALPVKFRVEHGVIVDDDLPLDAGAAVTIGAGLQKATIGSIGGVNPSGVTITITSSDPSVLLVAPDQATPGQPTTTITVASGATTFAYFVQGIEGSAGNANVIVSAPQFISGMTTATVVSPALQIANLNATTTTTAADDAFEVQIGLADATATAIAELQDVRAGGAPFAVTLTSSTPAVGQIVTSVNPAPGLASVQRVILPLSNQTVAGGTSFHALAVGTTTISASSPNATTIAGSSQSVTVGTAVNAVIVSPASTMIDVGGTVQLTATPVDINGNAVGVPVVFATQSTNFSLSATGLVTGVESGSGTVTATADGVIGSATIAVNSAPVAVITSPTSGSAIDFAQPVTFIGSGADVDDGALAGASLVWTSDRDGPIGTGASFTVSTLSLGTHTITLTVTDSRGATGTATAEITINYLGSITGAAVTLRLGGTGSLPINLSRPAPTGGATVTVTSSDPGRVDVVTSTVTFAAGQSALSATLSGVSPGTATITLTSPGFESGQTAATTAASLNIVQTSPQIFPQAFTRTIDIRLESAGNAAAAPAGGLPVVVTSSDPGCVAATSPLTIPAGQVTVQATLSSGGAYILGCTAQVTASSPDVEPDFIQVTVQSAPPINPGNPVSVGQQLQRTNVAILGSSAHGGTTVTVTSTDPTRLLLAPNATTAGTATISVSLLAGQTQVTYYVHGLGTNGVVPVTISSPGFQTTTASITVVTAAFDLTGPSASTTSFSPSTAFSVRVGIGTATALTELQAVRAGGSPLTATITNSQAPVAQLLLQPLPGQTTEHQSVSLQIQPTENSTPSSLALGGVAFDPLGVGTTIVAASIPGLSATNNATRTVDVTGPTINAGSAVSVGVGLQRSNFAILGASNHGGTTVRVESLDPSRALIAPNATTAGSAFIDVNLFDTQTQVAYHIQAIAGAATGPVQVRVTALGFANGTTTATLVQPALDLTGVPATTTSLSPSNAIFVRVGIPTSTLTGLSELQAVSAGGAPLTATVTNSTAAVAQLVTTAATGQSVTVQIAPGDNTSPSGVVNGGALFEPIAGGNTTVSASIPGFTSLPTSSRSVLVEGPAINAGSAVSVGTGLQRNHFGSLGASDHGGVTVTLTSTDPAKLLLSTSSTTAGAGSISFTLANGQTGFTYWLQAVTGTGDVVPVTVSAPGFSSGTAAVTIVQPAIDLAGLPTSTTTLSPNINLAVRTGIATPTNSALTELQAVRIGAPALTATVTNSNPLVAQLISGAVTGQSVTVQIQPGQSQSPTGLAFDGIGAGSTGVAASIPGFVGTTNAARTITVGAPGINAGGVATVGGGLQRAMFGALGASNHGGVTVTLTSSDPAKVLLAPNATTAGSASIAIPVVNNQTGLQYHVQALSNSGTVTVTAAAPGFTDGTVAVTLATAALDLTGIPATTTTLSPDMNLTVRVGIANATATALTELQPVRFGAPSLPVTVTNSDAAVGQLRTSGGPAQSITLQIQPNASATPGTLVQGGGAFEPLGTGTTTVAATISGLISTANASRLLTVDAPTINAGATSTVGGGLQKNMFGQLGASDHGGVTITLTSTDPSKALLSPNATTAGTPSITISLANGVTGFQYHVQALSASGTVPIDATAPGFTSTTTFVILDDASFDVTGLPTTTTASAANINFNVRMGLANQFNTNLTELQAVRAGGPPITVTFTNSNAAVARLVTTALTDQVVTVQVLPGQSTSPGGLAAGGAQFDPLGAGATIVTATAPGIVGSAAATRSITVNP